MATDYHSRHHANQRKILALLIEDMHPRTVVNDDYIAALYHTHRGDEQAQRNWRQPPRTFATCLDCLGEGAVPNDAWYDDDECREPETIDCETCIGCGIVEIVDRPIPISAVEDDDDLPF